MNLQEKRSHAAKAMRDMLDLAKGEERGLTADERAKHANMVQEINDIDDLMKRDKELAEMEARDNELESRTVEVAVKPPEDERAKEINAFRAFARGELPEFEQRTSYSSTTGAEGGFVVPTTLYRELKEYLASDNIIRQLATIEQWEGDGTFPVATSFGLSYLVSEGSAVDASVRAELETKNVTGYQLMYRADVPQKLIMNSQYPFEQKLMGWWGKSRAVKEEKLFESGTGSGEPTGLIIDTTGATDSTRTASNSALAGNDILNWFYDVPAGYRRRASWIFNDSIIKLIRQITNTVETSGALHYLWLPGINASEPDTLLGRPIYPSAAFESAMGADEKIGVFGDISQYIIVDFASPVMLRDPFSRASYGEIRFVGWQLIDTALPVREAIVRLKTSQ